MLEHILLFAIVTIAIETIADLGTQFTLDDDDDDEII